jgi:HprK-related kinase A
MKLGGERLRLRNGPFAIELSTSVPELVPELHALYAGYPAPGADDFVDFHIAITRPRGLRRWIHPQVRFEFDGTQPFKPLPRDQALPIFEWGLNWTIATQANEYLIIHAAAIERDGRMVIMPGRPGSGKSTLCAGLVNRGWRLLSDEMTLLRLDDRMAVPLARPISLKNESIAVMRRFVPGAVFSREATDTAKGTVALMAAPPESVARIDEPAKPAFVIFPRFVAGAPARIERVSKAKTLLDLGENAFNYSVHGARGFDCLADLLDECDCFEFSYGDLDEAVRVFAALDAPLREDG